MRSYGDIKKRLLADPEFRKEYEALGREFELIESIIKRCTELKMSQEDLAAKEEPGRRLSQG